MDELLPHDLPDDLAEALHRWGPRWHHDIGAARDAMVRAWTLHIAAAPAHEHRVLPDLAYGADPRQVLDVHIPPEANNAPVLVFVHGGAFVRGDRVQTPHLYANVPTEFARHGFIGINLEYRLAPHAPWPEGAVDVRDALLYIREHVAQWGGVPEHVFLMGHSAACSHCATAAWDDRVRPDDGLPIAGLILASPRVQADVRPENPNARGVRAYYGEDESLFDDRSPMGKVRPDATPTFIAVAEYENPLLEFQAFELAHRLARVADRQGGPMPRFIQYPEHNHVSMVAQFDTRHSVLGADIRRWISRVIASA